MWRLRLEFEGQQEEAQYESREEALEVAQELAADYDSAIGVVLIIDADGQVVHARNFTRQGGSSPPRKTQ